MGQAAIDLPDPTQAPPDGAAPAAASSADDLLSQLAGDEIDRLLAEAEVEKGPPPQAAAEAPAAESPATEAPVAEAPAVRAAAGSSADARAAPATTAPAPSVQARTAEPAKVETPAAASAAADSGSAASADADQAATNAAFEDAAAAAINELLNAATSEPSPDAAPAAPAAPEPTTVTSVVIEPPPSATLTDPTAAAKELDEALAKGSAAALPQVKLETETSNQEKSALAEVVQAMNEIEAAPEISFEGAPWYLKPLIWLNAPFAMLPEPVRDALGKIGILTFVNAIAVFAYLLMFRKHHH